MVINCAHTELVELHKLQPNPKNPNTHPDKQITLLAKIIDYQGQRAPIVVSKRSGFITKGHGRLMAITKLGWPKCAVDYQDYTSEAQEYADMVADNKIAELAEHDDAAMQSALLEMDFNLDLELLGMLDFTLPTAEEIELPNLENLDKKEIEQITFTITKDQADTIREAMEAANKLGAYVDTGNENKNGNAIARVAEFFLGSETVNN